MEGGNSPEQGVLPVGKLEVIFCDFKAENNFVNLLVPFIGVRHKMQCA